MIKNISEPKWFLIFAFFLGGVFLGGLGTYLWLNINYPAVLRIHSTTKYKYINPLLAVENYPNQKLSINRAMQLPLQNVLNESLNEGALASGAVYYRDLETGVWVGINEGSQFSPGKLLDIPLMITYFKLAEEDSGILEQELVFNGPNEKITPYFSNGDKLIPGNSYTVNDLIVRMIVKSDIDAAGLLFDNVDKTSLQEVFSDLGVNFIEDRKANDFITLKMYSLFFRVLYNSTYLSREYSEKALGLIDEANDTHGVASGIPKNILVSSRIGGTFDASTDLYTAFDCGIVYHPADRYLVCGVATGRNVSDLQNFLQKIGAATYNETNYRTHN